MQTGECTSRAVGWKEVGPRASSEASLASLDGLGPTAPAPLDQGWRGRDMASSTTHQAPGASASLIYLDPRTFTRDGIGRWLQSQLSGFRVCALPDPEQITAVPAAGDETRAVIINTGPERMSSAGVASLIARVGELAPSVPVAVLSDYEDADNVRAAFELGVRGYIPTSLPSGVAVQAVQLVCAGGTFAPAAALLSAPEARSGTNGATAIDGFTQRQAQILDCLRRGMANKLIAYELNMCESTVKVHIRNIMKKLNATNRTQVVYLTNGLFEHAGHYR